MVLRGEIQGFVYKGFPEVRAGQLQTDLEPRAAQSILIGIVHIEHEVERAATQAHAGDIDFLQFDLRALEVERVAERRARRRHTGEQRESPCGWHHRPPQTAPVPTAPLVLPPVIAPVRTEMRQRSKI